MEVEYQTMYKTDIISPLKWLKSLTIGLLVIAAPTSLTANFASSFFGAGLGVLAGSALAAEPEYTTYHVYPAHDVEVREYHPDYYWCACGCGALVEEPRIIRHRRTTVVERRHSRRRRRDRGENFISGCLGFGFGAALGAALNS